MSYTWSLGSASVLHTGRALKYPRWEDFNYVPLDGAGNRFHYFGDGMTLNEKTKGDCKFHSKLCICSHLLMGYVWRHLVFESKRDRLPTRYGLAKAQLKYWYWRYFVSAQLCKWRSIVLDQACKCQISVVLMVIIRKTQNFLIFS
jgi:hypothetical protein